MRRSFTSLGFVLLLGLASGARAAWSALVINELDYDQPGSDTAEFIELENVSNAAIDLSTYSLELINGASGESVVYGTIPLPAMNLAPSEFYVVCANAANTPECDLDVSPDTNLIQNGAPDAVALRRLGALVDVLSYEGDVVPPYTEGSGAALADTAVGAEGLSRCPDGRDSDANGLDFTLRPITPGAANDCPAQPPPLGDCGDADTPIHAIQAAGASSPLAGTVQEVEAVVVGDFQGASELLGFFLQEADSAADADPATSEGIFVFGPTLADVEVGEVVRLRGTVAEFASLTEMTDVSALAICASGTQVTPESVTLPLATPQSLEPFEGMLVHFPQTLHATEHFFLGRFGEVALSVGGRLVQPTQRLLPGPQALALEDLNALSRIRLDDGSGVQNPSAVPYLGPDGTLRLGDSLAGITGVLGADGRGYALHPTQTVSFRRENPRPLGPPAVGGSLRVAALNAGNYFATVDAGAPLCGPAANQGCRGADSALELERQRAKLVAALGGLGADILALVELENGVGDAAAADLVAGLDTASAAGTTWAYVATGPIGADAIRNGFLYQPAVVTPVGPPAILDSSVDPGFLDTKNRPVLAQSFRANATNELLTLAVVHLKSKGAPCDDVGDPDLGDGQGACNLTRKQAALALASWLATDPTRSGSDDFLILGDLNSYAREDPIAALEAAGYTNLVGRFAGLEAFSFVLDGQAGTLDYALASPALTRRVRGAGTHAIDADEPLVLDYNTEFNPAALYHADAFRASDHDPILVGIASADVDEDGIPAGVDDCPFFANPDQLDADRNGRGDACECGDQNGDGTLNVADLVAINLAIFEPALATPLCDANGDGACDVGDIVAANREIFSPGRSSTCERQPVPGP